MAFIRPFEPKDTEACKHICRQTLPPSLLASSSAITTLAPYLWTLQFTHLSPATCFVLDDGAGTAVGYVIGTPDVHALRRAYPRYVAEVLAPNPEDVPPPAQLHTLEPWLDDSGQVNPAHLAQKAYSVDWLVMEDAAALEGGAWRAMMHIDILEGWQAAGWGGKLVDRFVEGVKGVCEASGGELDYGRGVYLGVSPENTKVVGFYERLGWRVFEREGAEGVTMVRDL